MTGRLEEGFPDHYRTLKLRWATPEGISSVSSERFKKTTIFQGSGKGASLVGRSRSHLVVRLQQLGTGREAGHTGESDSAALGGIQGMHLSWETTGPDHWTPQWRAEKGGHFLHIYILSKRKKKK